MEQQEEGRLIRGLSASLQEESHRFVLPHEEGTNDSDPISAVVATSNLDNNNSNTSAALSNSLLFQQVQGLSDDELRQLILLRSQRLRERQQVVAATLAAAARPASLPFVTAAALGSPPSALLSGLLHPCSTSTTSAAPLMGGATTSPAAAPPGTSSSLEGLLDGLGQRQAFHLPPPFLLGSTAGSSTNPLSLQQEQQPLLSDAQGRLRKAPPAAAGLAGTVPHGVGLLSTEDSSARRKRSPEAFGAAGATVGELTVASSTFSHGAAPGPLAFDLSAAAAVRSEATNGLLGARSLGLASSADNHFFGAAATSTFPNRHPSRFGAPPVAVAAEPPLRPRRCKRKKKQDDQPNRPLTAYNIFFKDERAKMLSSAKDPRSGQKDPTKNLGFAKMAQTIAACWKTLDQPTKDYYLQQAALDRLRYDREMADYNARKRAAMEITRARLEASLDDETRQQYFKTHDKNKPS